MRSERERFGSARAFPPETSNRAQRDIVTNRMAHVRKEWTPMVGYKNSILANRAIRIDG